MAKDPSVGDNGPLQVSLALEASVMCFWLQNFRQPKILLICRELNVVSCLHGARVICVGTRGGCRIVVDEG